MSEPASAIECADCHKQFFNAPMLENHVFLTHSLPKLFKEGDDTLNLLRKAYAYHMVRGECEKHGPADCVCVHPDMESKEGELKLFCYACIVEAHRAEAS